MVPLHQHARLLRRSLRHAPRLWHQLRLVGARRLPLQLRRPPLPLQMVDALQLHPLRSARRWRRVRHGGHLLRVTAGSEGRC